MDGFSSANSINEPYTVVNNKVDHPVRGRVFGIIGFIISIDAIFGCLIPFVNVFALIESIISLIICKVSKKNTSFKLANVGHTLSIIALVFSIVTIIVYAILIGMGVIAIANDAEVQDFLNDIFTNGITITFN